jgi:hypothetical protein
VEQILEFAKGERCAVSIYLDNRSNGILVDSRYLMLSVDMQYRTRISDQLLPVLQEWLHLWGGHLQSAYLSNDIFNMTAILPADPYSREEHESHSPQVTDCR